MAKKVTHHVTVKVPVLSAVRPPAADLDVSSLVLSGPKLKGTKQLSQQIRQAVTAMTLAQTMEGASTLTISVTDWSGALMRSQLLTGAVTVTFDGLSYTLTKVARADTVMTLTFEETAVALLRLYNKPKKANRDNTTRAQFVRSMVQEVTQARIPFQCPEVNVRQNVAKPTANRVMAQRTWPR